MKTKRSLLAILFLGMLLLTGCEALNRARKTFQSNITGLDRTVEVYDYTGNLIKTYQGTIDVEASDNKVKFDLNGKRIMIYNAIVVVEEK